MGTLISILKRFINSDLTKPINTMIDEVKATLALIKAKTDTITADLFTATHASRIDANISSRQASWGATSTHASRIDASISSRASQASIDAIKDKTDLIKPVVGTLTQTSVDETGLNSTYKITTLLTLTASQRIELTSVTSSGTNSPCSGYVEVLEGGKVIGIWNYSEPTCNFVVNCNGIKLGEGAIIRIALKSNGWSSGSSTYTVNYRQQQ